MRSALSLFGVALALACAPRERSAGADLLEGCTLDDGTSARCGWVSVPEDHGQPGGAQIRLRVAVLPALGTSEAPDPWVILVGGPGLAATEHGPALARQLGEARRQRDVVLVDQRGTGSSAPLDCPELSEPDLAAELADDFDPKLVRACAARLDVRPELYTTLPAAHDLAHVLETLGYERANVYGGSYGTRAALVFAEHHPERVRTLVLDGSAPRELRLPASFSLDGRVAFDALLADCRAEPECSERYDPAAALAQLLADLDSGARTVRVRDPYTSERTRVALSREAVAGGVFGLLYHPALSTVLPLVLDRAVAGEWGPFVAAASSLARRINEARSVGMFFSVVCLEDVPRLTEQDLAATSDGFLGAAPQRALERACRAFLGESPPRLAEGYFSPGTVHAPTLLLSGQLDPVTPPRWATRVSARLPRSAHVVVPAAGHGAILADCVPNIVAEFVADADPASVDASCVRGHTRPPFFIGANGP